MSAEWKTALDAMLTTLRAAQQERRLRDGFETIRGVTELRWVFYERAIMLAKTNEWRTYFGLPPVDEALIERVERQAAGHVDYTVTYAVGCAEVAMGRNRLEATA